MSGTNYEEMVAKLKEMLKDLPPFEIPSKLSIHPYQPYFNIIYNTQNGVEPTRDVNVKFLKERPSEGEFKFDWDALREKYKHVAIDPDICPKCGKDWLNHEFGVPAPYCP